MSTESQIRLQRKAKSIARHLGDSSYLLFCKMQDGDGFTVLSEKEPALLWATIVDFLECNEQIRVKVDTALQEANKRVQNRKNRFTHL